MDHILKVGCNFLNCVSNARLLKFFPTILVSLFLKLLAESSPTMRKKFDRTYLSASRDSQANTMDETQSPDPITSTRSSGLRYRRSRPPGHSKLSGILSRSRATNERSEQVELNEIVTNDPGSNPHPFPDLENDMA